MFPLLLSSKNFNKIMKHVSGKLLLVWKQIILCFQRLHLFYLIIYIVGFALDTVVTVSYLYTYFICSIKQCILLILFVTPDVLLFTLSTLYAEFRVGRVRARRLEEDRRSLRNCRHVYSLLAGAAAIPVFSPGWRSSRSSKHAIFSPLVADPADTAMMR